MVEKVCKLVGISETSYLGTWWPTEVFLASWELSDAEIVFHSCSSMKKLATQYTPFESVRSRELF